MKLDYFKTEDFHAALRIFFLNLNIPVNYLADEPTSARKILKDTWKDNPSFQMMNDVYFLGMVDNAAFFGNKSIDTSEIKSDYDGVLIFGVTLNKRENNRLPTRSQLAEIARAFNREFFYTPVIVVYKYGKYLAFANTQRLKYKQEWREGEKAGKVSLLRDVDITNPHSGHERILNDLKIPTTGKNRVDSFAKLYAYWQDVFSVNILNKKFYHELSIWYFWAVKEVHFPSEPTVADEHPKKIDLATLSQEHNAKNVIRLLTRFLFVWFVKEKKLIPEELFDIDYLKDNLLKDLSPVRSKGLLKKANIESIYYKAILQNLFFASLNCPIKPMEKGDNRERGFRSKKNFGQHRDANYLMRYKDQFKNPEKFLKLINEVVPFLNGGLFECLDNKTDKIYIDGFSDNLVKPHKLIVPDYLFFGFDQEVDLSGVVGIKTKAYKKAKVKGLIAILESYKFTIAENTPIEEDVALDPELLGKVFENLLASYNPETKTTARKQTGSFYTPREIVNYMVDESLIAYLKNSVKNLNIEADELDKQFHSLLSFDNINPFAENEDLQKQIIHSLDNCKILDPACGSGAFPMGILQKMVHILQKVDPENKYWQELQLNKAVKATEGAFVITDKKEREQKLIEINDAFDEKINDPDYARKLFLVENCIYGVDIQPIATQISKLRFFISLIVDQKVDKDKPNFGIRALPNLETKFVAANTLIGIDKPEKQMSLFENQKVEELEKKLKNVRHRIFSAKSPGTKRRLRDKDKAIREKIGELLIKHGWANETAKQLASWDPYDQNASSPFFDPEWMFGIKDGFDVVVGNPPYVFTRDVEFDGNFKKYIEEEYFSKIERGKKSKAKQSGKINLFAVFIMKALFLCDKGGTLTYIVPNNILRTTTYDIIRKYILKNSHVEQIVDLGSGVFNNVTASTVVLSLSNKETNSKTNIITEIKDIEKRIFTTKVFKQEQFLQNVSYSFNIYMDEISMNISSKIKDAGSLLRNFCVDNIEGIIAHKHLIQDTPSCDTVPLIEGKDVKRYFIIPPTNFLIWDKKEIHRTRPDYLWEAPSKIVIQRISGGTRPLVCAVDTMKYKESTPRGGGIEFTPKRG
jgi:adenine-specific DNA-methyltransferase